MASARRCAVRPSGWLACPVPPEAAAVARRSGLLHPHLAPAVGIYLLAGEDIARAVGGARGPLELQAAAAHLAGLIGGKLLGVDRLGILVIVQGLGGRIAG